MSGNLQEAEYERYTQDDIFNLLYALAPYTDEQLDTIFHDQLLCAVGLRARNPYLVHWLAKRYEVPEEITHRIIDYDLNSWCVSIRKRDFPGKVISVRDRVVLRLDVWQKNKKALNRAVEFFDVPRDRYLDVGCLLGLALVNAAEAGFKRVVGVEILPHYQKFAESLKVGVENVNGGVMEYHVGDICDVLPDDATFNFTTCVDVLEHTPDLNLTIQRLVRLCATDGAVYVYQGNGRSLYFARNEPHYRLPCISILSKPLSCAILEHVGSVTEMAPYVVEQWPTYDEIEQAVAKEGFSTRILNHDTNIRNDGKYPHKKDVRAYIDAAKETMVKGLLPLLTTELKERVNSEMEGYFADIERDIDMLSDEAFRVRYLMDSWNIAITPSASQ